MLTLKPGSSCDVCAEEYGAHCLPHSIPCGHVLCANCCNTIVDKTSSRLAPVCPFCREQFTKENVRLIRMDFTSSGWSTPRQRMGGGTIEANYSVASNDSWNRKLLMDGGCSRSRAEARRLEDKVATVAAKKCSVEEVSSLHKELQEWLTSEVKEDADQTSSLSLSAALLRAILMNHLAHSEASKIAKTAEANLKGQLDDLEIANGKLETELHKLRSQYAQKSQECQTLATELSRLKVIATTLGTAPTSYPPPPPTPTPHAQHMTSTQSPLSRFNSVHTRSSSLSARPTTPSPSSASIRSRTPAPPSIRSHTPGPRLPPTPGPTQLRSKTPAPPVAAPRPRRLSLSATARPPAPKLLARSTSEEKQEAHQLWIPHVESDEDRFGYPLPPAKYSSALRVVSSASRSARYGDSNRPYSP